MKSSMRLVVLISASLVGPACDARSLDIVEARPAICKDSATGTWLPRYHNCPVICSRALLADASDNKSYPRTFSGNASWYGVPFHGRKTASGEIFDMNKLSAANLKLPLVTKVLIENPKTGQSAVVRVNDRGPYVHRRIMDLSREAARRLGTFNYGVGYIDCTVIESASKKSKRLKYEPENPATPDTSSDTESKSEVKGKERPDLKTDTKERIESKSDASETTGKNRPESGPKGEAQEKEAPDHTDAVEGSANEQSEPDVSNKSRKHSKAKKPRSSKHILHRRVHHSKKKTKHQTKTESETSPSKDDDD